MNPRQFFNKVVEMRKAQKQYFKTRNYNDLQRSKQLEAEIDNEIKRALEIEKTKGQMELF